ncbi:alpha/beta fold hydrolase, partial [Alphaproteobacteria bacterium]|nr:alpha/beta fold hydrolase [Alphaproteobacteria bacterium]
MKFKVYKNKKQFKNEELYFNDQNIIFIFHGLFGRAKNWHSIALRISSIFDGTIIVFDLRNHGENEPSTEISYSIMVNDVYEFIKEKNINKFSIIGHSMGGKLGMLFTLLYPQFVKQLFVVDIAPVDYPREEVEIVDHLLKIDVKNCNSRKDVDVKLSNYINDKELRSFLLQNLNFNNGIYCWSLDLITIKMGMKYLRAFPIELISNISYIETFCIFGENSPYMNKKYKDKFKTLFTNLQFFKIKDAGHW